MSQSSSWLQAQVCRAGIGIQAQVGLNCVSSPFDRPLLGRKTDDLLGSRSGNGWISKAKYLWVAAVRAAQGLTGGWDAGRTLELYDFVARRTICFEMSLNSLGGRFASWRLPKKRVIHKNHR